MNTNLSEYQLSLIIRSIDPNVLNNILFSSTASNTTPSNLSKVSTPTPKSVTQPKTNTTTVSHATKSQKSKSEESQSTNRPKRLKLDDVPTHALVYLDKR